MSFLDYNIDGIPVLEGGGEGVLQIFGTRVQQLDCVEV